MGGDHAGDPSDQGTQHEGQQLGVGGIDALTGGGEFVLADGSHGQPWPRALEPIAEPAHHGEQEAGKAHVALRGGKGLGNAKDANGAAGEGEVEAHHPQNFHQGNGGDGQVDAPQAQHHLANAKGQNPRDHSRYSHLQQHGADRVSRPITTEGGDLGGEQGSHGAPDRIEARGCQRQLAAAQGEIDRDTQEGSQQHLLEEGGVHGLPGYTLLGRGLPRSPWGRTSSIRNRKPKATASL